MLKVVIVGYGPMASSLALGVQETNHKIVGVFRWDRVKYNSFQLAFKDYFNPSKFTSFIKSQGLYEIKARSVNDEKFKKEILKLNPDVIIVGSWGEVLKKEIIILPKMACINVHPSLLPKYRGSNPYASVIKNGETKTGVTFHLMDESLDTGPILDQKEVEILPDDTGETLRNRCVLKARGQVKELLDTMDSEVIFPVNQDEDKATYYPRLRYEDSVIDWEKDTQALHNQIRGQIPWMHCYTAHKSQFLKIKGSEIIALKTPEETQPGTVISKEKSNLLVATRDKNKALLLKNVEVYGLNFLSNFYIKTLVSIGDRLFSFKS